MSYYTDKIRANPKCLWAYCQRVYDNYNAYCDIDIPFYHKIHMKYYILINGSYIDKNGRSGGVSCDDNASYIWGGMPKNVIGGKLL